MRAPSRAVYSDNSTPTPVATSPTRGGDVLDLMMRAWQAAGSDSFVLLDRLVTPSSKGRTTSRGRSEGAVAWQNPPVFKMKSVYVESKTRNGSTVLTNGRETQLFTRTYLAIRINGTRWSCTRMQSGNRACTANSAASWARKAGCIRRAKSSTAAAVKAIATGTTPLAARTTAPASTRTDGKTRRGRPRPSRRSARGRHRSAARAYRAARRSQHCAPPGGDSTDRMDGRASLARASGTAGHHRLAVQLYRSVIRECKRRSVKDAE